MDDKNIKLNLSNRVATLNPNAAEFIPSTLRSTVGNTNTSDATKLDAQGAYGKAILDRSKSTISNNSDDEVHQYWRHQLPDDITPDFKDELEEPGHLPLAGLSLHDGIESSRFSASVADLTLNSQQDAISLGHDNFILGENLGYARSSHLKIQSSAAFMTSAVDRWEEQHISGDQYLTNDREEPHYNGDSTAGYLNNFLGDHFVREDAAINPVEFLASQFPGFSAESLADVYYANGCDLHMTVEILTQLELHVDVGFSQNLNSKALSAPSFNMQEFPALPVADTQNGLSKYTGEDLQQTPNTYRSSSISKGAIDFASTVRKLASQESGHRNYEINGSAKGNVGASRSSQLISSTYNGHEKLVSGDKLRTFGTAKDAPVWLETGEAVANMYSESRVTARDFARLRNACFEQGTQAYLLGNKSLAKELSVKGQLYNMKMKEAHEKAKESIYRQRNPVATELAAYGRGQDHLIDLHGLHVNEAIQILKHELGILRSSSRSSGKRLHVMICVGTGHHTKGTRTPARLPVAVEQYLLNEGLHYTQPQPGLLRAVVY